METIIYGCASVAIVCLIFVAPFLLFWVLTDLWVVWKVLNGYRPTSWKAVFKNIGILLVEILSTFTWRGEYEDEGWNLP